ncbi:MAG: hypothetical protein ACLR9T_02205 [Thomasclavelia sp.]|uniref:hypothetical protein n=1 Tax=Thomasclavelia sp. TaxID=3025757 RepID=UPI0039A02206
MAGEQTLVTRNKKVAFYKVGEKFIRMTGFTAMSKSANPKEYARQYVDETGEITDVTGYSPSIEYTFDQYTNNEVHKDIIEITEDEKTGSAAVREIVIVDMTSPVGENNNEFEARKRLFAIIPGTDGDNADTYSYTGTLKSKSSSIKGIATLDAEGASVTFK